MFSALLRWLPVGGGAVALAATTAYCILGRRITPEQRERQRRQRLQRVGRITDGTVLDTSELRAPGGAMQLLIYNYYVAGVSYEASQDVTHLRQYVDLHTCRIGLPASIKYDPQNPGDSMVVAEEWSGLRKLRQSAESSG